MASTQFYRAGGFVTDTVTDIICLHGRTVTSGNVSTLRKVGSTSGYQVTAGKTFYVTKIVLSTSYNGNIAWYLGFGYADNDCGQDTNTARTNPVALMGNPEGTGNAVAGLTWNCTASGANQDSAPFKSTFDDIILPFSCGGKYIYYRMINDGAAAPASIFIWGFEK